MERTTLNALVALLVGSAIAAGLYWFVGYPGLALVAGLCWACGMKLTLDIGRLYPEYATGETWTDKRWTGLGVGLVTLAALVGISPILPLSSELRLGLGFLVIGAGFVSYAAGTLAVLERVSGDSNARSSSTDPSYSPGDD